MTYIELVYTDLDRIEYETLRALQGNYPLDTADTTLIMDDGAELSAHEFVLSAFSSVFNRSFCHLQPDLNDGKYWIRLRHIPTRIMENILSMSYKGGVRFPAQDFRRLRKTARHFSLNGFVDPVSLRRKTPLQQLWQQVQASERFKSASGAFSGMMQ
ncbi:hypothetical protein TCAL_14739 [Tigriopus californicus]|uniref:BTB domain-containing protein n=1 Tax=Tigriopus californicus TaxID=6832 RepID=A0A553PEY3_TIGCA|nr:hypothetical protein TCAL_14739 [Tigriopus californicus]